MTAMLDFQSPGLALQGVPSPACSADALADPVVRLAGAGPRPSFPEGPLLQRRAADARPWPSPTPSARPPARITDPGIAEAFTVIHARTREVLRHLRVIYKVKTDAPYCICPYCGGAPWTEVRADKCEGCGGVGWGDRSMWDSAPLDWKAAVDARGIHSPGPAEGDAELAAEDEDILPPALPPGDVLHV